MFLFVCSLLSFVWMGWGGGRGQQQHQKTVYFPQVSVIIFTGSAQKCTLATVFTPQATNCLLTHEPAEKGN